MVLIFCETSHRDVCTKEHKSQSHLTAGAVQPKVNAGDNSEKVALPLLIGEGAGG